MLRFPHLKDRLYHQEEFDFREWLQEIGFVCIEMDKAEDFSMYRYHDTEKGNYIYVRENEKHTYIEQSTDQYNNEDELLKAMKEDSKGRNVGSLLAIITPRNRSFSIQLFAHLFQ